MLVKKLRQGLGFVSRQERTFKLNMARVSFHTFSLALTQQYSSIYTVGLGADPIRLGAINGLGSLAGSAVTLPAGWLADKYGIRRLLLLGTALVIAGKLLFFLASDWLALIPAIALVALATRILDTVCPMICGNCLKITERATVMQLCDTIGFSVPALFSPIVAALVITGFGGMTVGGIRPLYGLQLLCLTLILIMMYALFKDPETLSFSRKPLRFSQGMRELLKEGGVVKRWIVLRSLSDIPFAINAIYLPLYAAKIKEANQLVLGEMAMASMILPIILSALAGRLADNVGRKKAMYIITPFYCLSIPVLIYASNAAMLIISGFLQGSLMLGLAMEMAMTVELVPKHMMGRWLGLLGFFGGILGLVTPIASGTLWDIIGPESVFLFLLSTQFLKLLILAKTPETLSKQRNA